MKHIRSTAVLSSLLMTLSLSAAAQTYDRYQDRRDDDNCMVIRNYQPDGAFTEERRCLTVGAPDFDRVRDEPFLRNEQRLTEGLRRNERLYDEGRIGYDEFQSRQRRLNEALARNDQQRFDTEQRMARIDRARLEAERAAARTEQARLEAQREIAQIEQRRLEAERDLARLQQQRAQAAQALAMTEARRAAARGPVVGATAAYATQSRTAVKRKGNKETFWRGNCKVERTYKKNGKYSEKRDCH